MEMPIPRTPPLVVEQLRCTGTIVVFDTEYTAWEGSAQNGWSRPGEEREIVQIGAIKVAAEDFRELDAFSILVRPVINPALSDYFIHLTGITQNEVDESGQELAFAVKAFSDFVRDVTWVLSNGDDRRVIAKNCALLQVPCPLPVDNFRSLHPLLPQLLRGDEQPISSHRLIDFVGAQGDESAHQAISDARVIVRTLQMLRAHSRV